MNVGILFSQQRIFKSCSIADLEIPDYLIHCVSQNNQIVDSYYENIYITNILNTIGLKSTFHIIECEYVSKAVAFSVLELDNSKTKYIAYNKDFFKELENITNVDYYSTLSILAHEIGHQLLDHTTNSNGDILQEELLADEFSGFIMGNLRVKPEDAESAIRTISSTGFSTTHPPLEDRINAIKRGYSNALKFHRLTLIKYVSDYPYGITFILNGTEHRFNQNESKFFPNLSDEGTEIFIWECPQKNNCGWSNFTILPGNDYEIVDSGDGRGLKLICKK